jgi:DNA-binding NtrC family response regulator
MTTESRSGNSGAHQMLVGVEVLVLDSDERVHAGMQQLLSEANLHVTCVKDAETALAAIAGRFYSVALVDIDTSSPRDGIETIGRIKVASPTTMVIAMTPRRSYEDAVDAVRAGAVDLILKAPDSVKYLKDRVLDAIGRSVGKREVDSVLDEFRYLHH